MREITQEELATNDGREGRPAWVAYEGTVYDVTDSAMWVDGEHMDHQAGRDLTEEHAEAPHDVLVTDLPAVGSLA
ncbi:MAG: cytochrome B5 [Coriobacteriia bacterium]|nr:cytochrome B5 [Coriobacteriia bacterium]